MGHSLQVMDAKKPFDDAIAEVTTKVTGNLGETIINISLYDIIL